MESLRIRLSSSKNKIIISFPRIFVVVRSISLYFFEPMSKHEKVSRYLTDDATVRIAAVVNTELIQTMQSILKTYPLATVALGRSLTGCVLMASHLKEGHSVGAYFRGEGPLGTFFAEASHEGAARAYSANPHCRMPAKDGKLDIQGAVGKGILEIVRGTPIGGPPHKGLVQIQTGEVGDDFAYYLQQSHQIPSVVALGTVTRPDGSVEASGGVLIELLPGAPQNVALDIENRVKKVASLSALLKAGVTSEDLIKAFLQDLPMSQMEHDYHLRYECKCSQDRVERALLLLGTEELEVMLQDQKDLEIQCDFCGRHYTVTSEELQKVHQKSYRSSMN